MAAIKQTTYLNLVLSFSNIPILKKYNNAQLRGKATKIKFKNPDYLHAIKFDNLSGHFTGYICGPNKFEIEYWIDQSGFIKITNNPLNLQNSTIDNLIGRDFDKFDKKVIKDSQITDFSDNSKKGKFYLRRKVKPSKSTAMSKAEALGIISSSFATQCLTWGFTMREGKK